MTKTNEKISYEEWKRTRHLFRTRAKQIAEFLGAPIEEIVTPVRGPMHVEYGCSDEGDGYPVELWIHNGRPSFWAVTNDGTAHLPLKHIQKLAKILSGFMLPNGYPSWLSNEGPSCWLDVEPNDWIEIYTQMDHVVIGFHSDMYMGGE